MKRRTFFIGSTASLFECIVPHIAKALPSDSGFNLLPPIGRREDFIAWMMENRSESQSFLKLRWDRLQALIRNKYITDERNMRAFLLTPREEFVLPRDIARAYEAIDLDIGHGVVISGPHLVARMTSAIDIRRGEKVLEIGTGSGYQSAYLSNLTDKVWTVEIIKPLAQRTRGIYDSLVGRGYGEYKSIRSKNGDGYYGWDEAAPFDKIIVTCGIDHVPPPLLEQVTVGGSMVIPVGPPGAQRILKVVKQSKTDGSVTVVRTDAFNGKVFAFVPFTKLEGEMISGTHFRSK